jgi:uncharacterized protein (TIGR02231 family)
MNYKSTSVACFLYFFIATFLQVEFPAAEASEVHSGKIYKVKLYSDRAEIYREIKVSLSGGTSHITVGPLPDKLITNSLRVVPVGNAEIGNFQLERVFENSFTSQAIKKQNELVKELQNNLNWLDDQLKIFDDQIRFIESIRQPDSKLSTDNANGPDHWDAVLKFKSSRGTTTRELRRKSAREIRDEKNKLENARKKLKDMMADSRKGHYLASMDISAPNAAETTLGVVYQIRNAGWKPVYHLHADTLNNQTTLSYFGEIDQNTGEDWNDISLELSTGQPSRGTNPPRLSPWIVDYSKPRVRSAQKFSSGLMNMAERQQDSAMSAPKRKAIVVQAGTSYTFEIPQQQTISAGTRKFRALIVKEIIASDLTYTAVPKISKKVFLTGKHKNTGDFQWLPGQSEIYLDGSFVGRSRMKSTSPGQTLELGLGEDSSIRIERKLIKKETGGKGIFGQNEKVRFVFEIKLENFKKQPVKLTLKDQLPLPYHEDIKVAVNRIEPQANETDKQNFLIWNLTLAPGETKTITLDFQVEYPRKKVVNGL